MGNSASTCSHYEWLGSRIVPQSQQIWPQGLGLNQRMSAASHPQLLPRSTVQNAVTCGIISLSLAIRLHPAKNAAPSAVVSAFLER